MKWAPPRLREDHGGCTGASAYQGRLAIHQEIASQAKEHQNNPVASGHLLQFANVGIAMINHPCLMAKNNPFMVIRGMVCYC